MVNHHIGKYFPTMKGLRRGDPFSPIIFNIAVDVLSVLVERAKEGGLIKPLILDLVGDALAILQYADDTILFMDHNLEKALNMKLILCIFEHLLGLKINFLKSEVFLLWTS